MFKFNILLTGSNGFLGSAIRKHFQTIGVDIETACIRSKTDVDVLIHRINKSKAQYKILNAGWSGVKYGSLSLDIQNQNLELQKYLFQIADCSSVIHFINFGSYNEYGSLTGLLTEDLKFLKPISEYAIVKNILRRDIEDRINASKYLHLRISNVYGPTQPLNSLYGTILGYSNKPLNFGAGNAIRDMLYIDDLCDAIFRILNSDINGILNIGSGISLSNKEFILRLSAKLKIPVSQINFDNTKKDNIFMADDFTLSVSKAKTLLGWEAISNS